MIRPALALAAIVWLAAPTGAAADETDATGRDWWKSLRLRGRVAEEVAYRLHDRGDISKLRSVAWLDAKWTPSDAVNVRALGRGWWDGVFHVTDRYPDNVRRDAETDISLREALVSLSLDRVDLRVGRQQIVWGEALGIFVTDVVNPRDFREFILPDFAEVRLPIWAIDLIYHVSAAVTLEGVWTPDTRPHKIPKRGAEFEFEPPRFRFPGPVVVLPDDRDEFSLERSEGGARLSALVRGWDLSVLYYDAADKFPVRFQRRIAAPPGPPITVLEPRHPRLRILGATLTKSLEPLVFRGEAALAIGKRYETVDVDDPDGVVRRDTLDYVVGIDYPVAGVLDTAVQLHQKVLLGSARGVEHGDVQGRVTTALAIRLATSLAGEALQPSVLCVVGIDRRDYRVSPRLDWIATGALTITLGADIFAGPVSTLYGQFHDNDRLFVEATWRF